MRIHRMFHQSNRKPKRGVVRKNELQFNFPGYNQVYA
jgi:hypothetical protein